MRTGGPTALARLLLSLYAYLFYLLGPSASAVRGRQSDYAGVQSRASRRSPLRHHRHQAYLWPAAVTAAQILAIGIARTPAAPHPPLAWASPLRPRSAHFHPAHCTVAELSVQLADKLGCQQPDLGRPGRRVSRNGQLAVRS